MKKRWIGNTGIESSVLGMGCMRLPILEGKSEQIDEAKAIDMIRYAIDHGVTYIDTAYNYHGGNSEIIVGQALQNGYREKVSLVTKAPSWLIKAPGDFERLLDEQLQKLQVDYLDIYLLHSMNKGFWENYKTLDVFSDIERLKKSGKIKNIGFSFHDSYEVFEEVIQGYAWDVCMLQYNYMDEEDQAGLKGLKLAESLNIPVIVMEPLKGGLLSNPPEDIQALWQSSGRNWSPVEWALRFIANHSHVKVILSGMSTMEQIEENIAIGEHLLDGLMTDADFQIIEQVKASYLAKVQVPCTECEYCMPCPHGVEIPRVFSFYNRAHIFSNPDLVKGSYMAFVKPEGKAGSCIACGLCEPKCPQTIHIIDSLKQTKAFFGA